MLGRDDHFESKSRIFGKEVGLYRQTLIRLDEKPGSVL